MKPPRSVKPLPRYMRRKPLTGGRWGYFFEPPTWARRAGCPVDAEPLGDDYDLAVRRAEDILLKAFDSWRTGGLSDMVPIGPSIGTFDWLVSVFKVTSPGKRSTGKHSGCMSRGLSFSQITP
jgi:hypothetical protein